jgi:hypothetical protein
MRTLLAGRTRPSDSWNMKMTVSPHGQAHCMHCVDDDVTKQPALWSAYVRNSRRNARGQRGMTLGIYGGLGHH